MRRKIYTVDASLFTSRGEAHAVMKQVFEGYEYYGNNLDALHDVLTSIRKDVKIRIIGLDYAALNIEEYADRIRQVFIDSAEENPHLALEFADPAAEDRDTSQN